MTEIAKGLKSRYTKTLLSVNIKLNLYYIEKPLKSRFNHLKTLFSPYLNHRIFLYLFIDYQHTKSSHMNDIFSFISHTSSVIEESLNNTLDFAIELYLNSKTNYPLFLSWWICWEMPCIQKILKKLPIVEFFTVFCKIRIFKETL